MDTANKQQQEGPVAKAIETQTSKIPSDIFLWTGLAIGAAAMTLYCTKRRHLALLIAQGIAPVMLMGIYNKMVKQMGHDVDEPIVGENEKSDNTSSQKNKQQPKQQQA